MLTRRNISLRPGYISQQAMVEAICYGEFGVFPCIDGGLFVICLLPLGMQLPPDWCSFQTEDQACEAMVHIARLRNDWAVITQADLTLELKAKIMQIAKDCGAVENGPIGHASKADFDRMGRFVKTRPNGYGQALG